MSVDQLKNKTTSQLAELGNKSDAINRMKIELGEKNATIFSLEAREKAVKEQLRATEEEFAAKTEALRTAEQALSDKQSELAKIQAELSDRSIMAESRQVELVACAPRSTSRSSASARPKGSSPPPRRGWRINTPNWETATRELNEARGRVENLSQRVTDLDRQLIIQVKEGEMLGSRVTDLEARLPRRASFWPSATMKNRPVAPDQQAANAGCRNCATTASIEPRQIAGDQKISRREGRHRGAASAAARDERAKTSARPATRSSSRPRAHGRPSAWKMRCCVNASTTSPPRSQSWR